MDDFNDLNLHNRNCSTTIDQDVSIIFCEDGYFSIDSKDNFFKAGKRSFSDTNTTLDLLDAPKDVRLDKFITLVDNVGQSLTIIRKSNSELS